MKIKEVRKQSQKVNNYPKEAIASVKEVDVVDKSVRLDNKKNASKYRVTVLKRMAYKDSILVARKIGFYFFEYLVIRNNDLYTWNIELRPSGDKDKGEKFSDRPLNRDEILRGAEIVLMAGATTIDKLMEIDRLAQKKDNKKINKKMLN